jgi:TetR/AcrR family transcriptional repressor of nem operon
MASLATMAGTLVLARVAGTGELSNEIMASGREAVLARAAPAKTGRKKAVKKDTPKPVSLPQN